MTAVAAMTEREGHRDVASACVEPCHRQQSRALCDTLHRLMYTFMIEIMK